MADPLAGRAEYIVQALGHMERTGAASLDVHPERQNAFNREIQARLASSVWTEGGCRSWYLDPDGGTSVLWPGATGRFPLQRFEPADYRIVAPATEPVGVPS